MTDEAIIDAIKEGLLDGNDLDATDQSRAEAVLRALRANGVFRAEWEAGQNAAAAECDRMRESYRRSLSLYPEDDQMHRLVRWSGATAALCAENIRALVYAEATQ
jgi:hypothetical protein